MNRFFTQRVFGHWNRITRKVVQSPSQTDSRTVILWVSCADPGVELDDTEGFSILKGPSNSAYSVILSFLSMKHPGGRHSVTKQAVKNILTRTVVATSFP